MNSKWIRMIGGVLMAGIILGTGLQADAAVTPTAGTSTTTGVAAGPEIASFATAAHTTSLITVIGTRKSNAILTMYEMQPDGSFQAVLADAAVVGRNGFTDHHKEGDGATPTGTYSFLYGFGILPNPGTTFPYLQAGPYDYFVDDVNSPSYNTWVNTSITPKNFSHAEHIVSISPNYRYALALNYNSACIPGEGSAIFLHCKGGSTTSGCIAISEPVMKQVLLRVKPETQILIFSNEAAYRKATMAR